MRSHPLKGVEPELFSPEELLGGARHALPSASRPAYGSHTPPQTQQVIHRSDSDTSDRQQSGSWFQLPWRVTQQDDAPHSRRVSRDDRGVPLNQPPLVSGVCNFATIACTIHKVKLCITGHYCQEQPKIAQVLFLLIALQSSIQFFAGCGILARLQQH